MYRIRRQRTLHCKYLNQHELLMKGKKPDKIRIVAGVYRKHVTRLLSAWLIGGAETEIESSDNNDDDFT